MKNKKYNFRKKTNKDNNEPLYIYGLHSVRAALDNEQREKIRLYASPNALAKLEAKAPITGVEIEQILPRQLDKLLGKEAIHQGVALEVKPLKPLSLKAIKGAKQLIVLDQISDPHNVGAILRSACAFGVDALITTARFAPKESAVLAKSASGALDLMPIVEVNNLANALQFLKDDAMTILGFDSEGEDIISTNMDLPRVAIVLGAEGKGLRQRTRQMCDKIVRLEMKGKIKSLNVSNAAAIALFALNSKN